MKIHIPFVFLALGLTASALLGGCASDRPAAGAPSENESDDAGLVDSGATPPVVLTDGSVPSVDALFQDSVVPPTDTGSSVDLVDGSPGPDAPPTDRCEGVFGGDPCSDCISDRCCDQVVACQAHATCMDCFKTDGDHPACETPEAEAIFACATGPGGACSETCFRSFQCESVLTGACGQCFNGMCCDELAKCAGDAACWDCLEEPTDSCMKNTRFAALANCGGAHCGAECDTNQCIPDNRYCERDGDCCSGTCEANHKCKACEPNCNGKECGDNGCGGTCGACSGGESCSNGRCECKPKCDGKTCGDDGCGGVCGSCTASQVCTSGRCCTPNCNGLECGSDGCGGTCGTCSGGQVCASGSCCTRSCSGKQCGSDSCGGTCGSCSGNATCQNGQCIKDPNDCDPVYNTGCEHPNECILLSSEKTFCGVVGYGTQGDYCSASVPCAGGHGCFGGTCRKVCDKFSGEGCSSETTCTGVSGWSEYGACG